MVDAFEIIVRAHDKKKNFQPEHITWLVSYPLSLASSTDRHPHRNLTVSYTQAAELLLTT